LRHETASCLSDALLAAERIQEKLAGVDEQEYSGNWETQSVVERQFIVLGESLVRIRELEPSIFERLPDSSRVVGFRNLLVHAYDKVLPERVFQIAREDLPSLREEVAALIEEAKRQGL